MRLRLSQAIITIAAATALMGWSAIALDEDDIDQARQHGYEHGYRDGYHHGREDRERRAKYDFETNDYKKGDRGYDEYMGDKDDYKEAYRTGYQSGYADAYANRSGKFAEIYGREVRDRDGAIILELRPGGFPDIAYDNGYQDGIRAGQKDLRSGVAFDPADHASYRDGDHGYQNNFGDLRLYKRNYREGFMRGYQNGYGRLR